MAEIALARSSAGSQRAGSILTGGNEQPGKGKTWSLALPFRREGSVGWVAELPAELHVQTDTNEEPYRSRLRLAEDGRALGRRMARTRRSGAWAAAAIPSGAA